MKCLAEGCEHEAVARGLCGTCHRRYSYRVKHGKATWSELIKKGLAKRARKVRNMSTARRSENARLAIEFTKEESRRAVIAGRICSQHSRSA
jgi:hypothetical protein